jgi:hypothetical protein
MSKEYQAIHKAGLILQIDAPDLAMDRTMLYRDLSDVQFVAACEKHVAAINKGIEPPALPEALLVEGYHQRYRSPEDCLRRGLIWSLLGISVYFAVRANEGPDKALYGLILVAIGAANLIYYFIAGRKASMEPAKNPETKPAPAV